MRLNELRDNEGARKKRVRVGRGIGSGKGKTSGRGVKGQKSRSGVAIKGFEGGQNPLYRRLPKRGFTAPFSTDYNIVSIARLEQAVEAGRLDAKKPVTAEVLVEAGVLRRVRDGVRVLADGAAKTKFALEVAGASRAAVEKIEKAGGSVTILAAGAKPDAEAADA